MKKLIISSVEETIVDIVDNDNYHYFSPEKVRAEDLLKVISLRLGKDKMQDVGDIYINMGPGSFTGIRAGLSLVFGLTAGTKINLIPFTTFDMFEYNKLTVKEILAVNGFSNFVYIKRKEKNKTIMECVEIEKLAELCKKNKATIYTYSKMIEGKLKEFNVNVNLVDINAKNVYDKHKKGELEKIKTEPIYLRLSQAEMQRKEKQK